jgi:hypothetical protein
MKVATRGVGQRHRDRQQSHPSQTKTMIENLFLVVRAIVASEQSRVQNTPPPTVSEVATARVWQYAALTWSDQGGRGRSCVGYARRTKQSGASFAM